MRAPLHPLSLAVCGERLKVEGFSGCRKIEGRLRSMGLLAGDVVEILSNTGPVLVGVGAARLALAPDLAQHVLVSVVAIEYQEKYKKKER